MKRVSWLIPIVFIIFAGATPAWAPCGLSGYVFCDVNQNGVIDDGDTPYSDVGILIDGAFATDTDENGFYYVLDHYVCDATTISLDLATLPADAIFINPSENQVAYSGNWANPVQQDWLIDSATCREQSANCWLTAGGVKFSAITGTMVDELKKPLHSWGGNVNPACAPVKGHWNHIAHGLKLHFQASDIEVVECGNVEGIPPGSESPVTPVNYIHFTSDSATATVAGIKGNKLEKTNVCWIAYVEDRNEPGSNGAKDGNDVDRYYLHVWDCEGTGDTLILVDLDGAPDSGVLDVNEYDPVTVTGGNMQMHYNPCE